LFVQAAIEDLPEELNGVADEIHIHFPWGSLLKAVATGDNAVLPALRRIAAPGCLVEIIIGLDSERDAAEIDRLNIAALTPDHIQAELFPEYQYAGFEIIEYGVLDPAQWKNFETSWARKLQGNSQRTVFFLLLRAR
jgi:hypothetical protein